MRPITRIVAVTSLAATMVTAGVLFAGVARAADVTVTPQPAPQSLLDLIDSGVEANTGTGVWTVSNDNPTTWVGEDDSELQPGEELIYRLYSYAVDYPALECAEHTLTVTMTMRADGPDIGIGDNSFLGMVDSDGVPLAGRSYFSPASIGESIEMMESGPVSAQQLREGFNIGYGATTYQDGLSSGYTFTAPEVEVTEDLKDCDLDADGVSDDVDPDNTDACVPDPNATACVKDETTSTSPAATTTTLPASPPSAAPVVPVQPSGGTAPAPLRATG